MAGDRRFSSVFDTLLDDNKRQLDALMGGGAAAVTGAMAREPVASGSTASDRAATTPERSTGVERAADDWSDSAAAAELNARFGNRWRFEIRERQREGDEIIVLGRLSVLDKELSRSQFGAATLGAASGPSGVSQGVVFSLGGVVRDERAATRAAALAALDNCARML